ncbi:hypothetical protein HK101_008968 [Irineochytrium annulatum]|nr:hypothetical protein HK101_008968 [Irineochytrium annulatum]
MPAPVQTLDSGPTDSPTPTTSNSSSPSTSAPMDAWKIALIASLSLAVLAFACIAISLWRRGRAKASSSLASNGVSDTLGGGVADARSTSRLFAKGLGGSAVFREEGRIVPTVARGVSVDEAQPRYSVAPEAVAAAFFGDEFLVAKANSRDAPELGAPGPSTEMLQWFLPSRKLGAYGPAGPPSVTNFDNAASSQSGASSPLGPSSSSHAVEPEKWEITPDPAQKLSATNAAKGHPPAVRTLADAKSLVSPAVKTSSDTPQANRPPVKTSTDKESISLAVRTSMDSFSRKKTKQKDAEVPPDSLPKAEVAPADSTVAADVEGPTTGKDLKPGENDDTTALIVEEVAASSPPSRKSLSYENITQISVRPAGMTTVSPGRGMGIFKAKPSPTSSSVPQAASPGSAASPAAPGKGESPVRSPISSPVPATGSRPGLKNWILSLGSPRDANKPDKLPEPVTVAAHVSLTVEANDATPPPVRTPEFAKEESIAMTPESVDGPSSVTASPIAADSSEVTTPETGLLDDLEVLDDPGANVDFDKSEAKSEVAMETSTPSTEEAERPGSLTEPMVDLSVDSSAEERPAEEQAGITPPKMAGAVVALIEPFGDVPATEAIRPTSPTEPIMATPLERTKLITQPAGLALVERVAEPNHSVAATPLERTGKPVDGHRKSFVKTAKLFGAIAPTSNAAGLDASSSDDELPAPAPRASIVAEAAKAFGGMRMSSTESLEAQPAPARNSVVAEARKVFGETVKTAESTPTAPRRSMTMERGSIVSAAAMAFEKPVAAPTATKGKEVLDEKLGKKVGTRQRVSESAIPMLSTSSSTSSLPQGSGLPAHATASVKPTESLSTSSRPGVAAKMRSSASMSIDLLPRMPSSSLLPGTTAPSSLEFARTVPAGENVIALHSFRPGRYSDELFVTPGDLIKVVKVFDDGWVSGVNLSKGRKEGFVPAFCVKRGKGGDDTTIANLPQRVSSLNSA